MGDVLTGVIGSLLAQGYSPFEAVTFGAMIHGKAGDVMVLENGYIGNLPSELINYLPKVMNEL